VHDGKRPHKCIVCQAAFASSQSLKQHFIIKHDDSRAEKCEICEASCASNHLLKKHIALVHEGKRPFECDICQKNFGTKAHVTRHKKSVHDDKIQPSVLFDREKFQSIENQPHPKIHLRSKVSFELTHNFKLINFTIYA
jgi:uncharacterized Zn-finger protein